MTEQPSQVRECSECQKRPPSTRAVEARTTGSLANDARAIKSPVQDRAGKTLTLKTIQPTSSAVPILVRLVLVRVNICDRSNWASVRRVESRAPYCTRPTADDREDVPTQSQDRSKPRPPLTRFRQQLFWHSEHGARNARTSQRRPCQKSWHHLLNISRPRK